MNAGDEKEPVPVATLLDQAERIMSRNREGTERIQQLWTAGEIKLPCHDSCEGSIIVAHGQERIRGFCPQHMVEGVCPLVSRAERELRARLTLAGFGPRYHEPKAEEIRCRPAVEQYLGNLAQNVKEGRGLIFTGDTGVGKTMALAYIARRMLVENLGVAMFSMQRGIDSLVNQSTRREAVRRVMAVQVLMLDDFGAGHMPIWVLGILEGIIEYRYAHQMPVLVSTNMTKDRLVAATEFRRMVDRWRQTNKLVQIGGTSQRHE